MEKIPQKLDKKKSEIYANAPIAKYGERKADFGTMGRKMKNPHKKFREVGRLGAHVLLQELADDLVEPAAIDEVAAPKIPNEPFTSAQFSSDHCCFL